MASAAIDQDEAAQEGPVSGVRPRVVVLPTPAPRATTGDVLADVGQEVFFQVLRTVRALSPIQTPWMRFGWRQAAGAAADASAWSLDGQPASVVLRARWYELVPGTSAIDELTHLMVAQIVD